MNQMSMKHGGMIMTEENQITQAIATFSTIYTKVQIFASYLFATLMFHVSVLKNWLPLQSMCYVDACSSNTGES
jgi:hypothetical protein